MGKIATIRKHPKLDGGHLWRLQISGQRGAGFKVGVGLWQLRQSDQFTNAGAGCYVVTNAGNMVSNYISRMKKVRV